MRDIERLPDAFELLVEEANVPRSAVGYEHRPAQNGPQLGRNAFKDGRSHEHIRRQTMHFERTARSFDGVDEGGQRGDGPSALTRTAHTSTTRSCSTSRPVISRSTKAKGASTRGESHGGP